MGKRAAVSVYAVICLLLALLLVVHSITPLASGSMFAVSLIVPGIASGGFRK